MLGGWRKRKKFLLGDLVEGNMVEGKKKAKGALPKKRGWGW